MKQPQKRSKSKRRAVLAASGSIASGELARMGRAAIYQPSPYHKTRRSGPGLFGVSGLPAPRPDKTVCDSSSAGASGDAAHLLRAGFHRGMVSQQRRGHWPQNVWAVDDDGTVYEAQLGNLLTGEYHGYPMQQRDSFATFIRDEWKRRAT